jgi:hypothetical protein
MSDWLPSGERSRRVFVIAVLGGCVLLGVVRFLLVPTVFDVNAPDVAGVIGTTLGDMIATALAATLLGLLLFWVFPPPSRPAVVENLPAHEIRRCLTRSVPESKRWWYDGSTGRFQRASTLPEMARWARVDGTSRDVTVMILDPVEEDLCRRYADYRQGVASGADGVWTVGRVREDIYATLLACARFNRTAPLSVTVALKSTMSILRYDLSDVQLVITKEGSKDPAILCPGGSFYYDAYLESLRWSLKQARTVDVSRVVFPDGGFDGDSARQAFTDMGVYTETLDHNKALARVIEQSLSEVHPYA